MTSPSPFRLRLAIPLVAALAMPTPFLVAGEGEQDVQRWAMDVWNAARRGDEAGVEANISRLPAPALDSAAADRFRSSVDAMKANRERAAESQREARTEAIVEMRTERDADNLAAALRKAVTAQTLSDDLNSAFNEPEIMELVRWAKTQLPQAERDRLWLDAQEIMYLLRTFYEDTSRQDEFQYFDDHLEQVNRRVGLLARYSPRKLHEMRNERATRLGEEPYGDFNPATAIDWHERLEGVDHHMLKAALQTAAAEHVESKGWRDLMSGGLESLKLFATTTPLAEAFPTLAEANRVNRWTAAIDGEAEALDRMPDRELDRWAFSSQLDRLVRLNGETIDVPVEVVLREYGDGAMHELDTYSEIIWPEKLRRFQQATAGNFVGIGILIRHNDKREIMVVNPLEGTPAYFKGVKPNDLIMTVDGDSTVGWSLNDAVDRITGPKGSVVSLGLQREGADDLVTVPIERDIIKIRSVKGWWKRDIDQTGDPIWDWYVDDVSRIAYIRLTQFTEDSLQDIRQAWREIRRDGRPNGLIFDLRHNPGGLLTAAVQISNLWVPEGSIVTGEDKHGNRAWGQDARRHQAELVGVPTVVLINRGSASASEIVAGCLQAHGAAVVVGDRSFGKGSVQTIHHIAHNGRLKLTTQYYRLPSPDGRAPGRLVHKRTGATVWGVDPDIEVPMSAKHVRDAIELRQSAEVIPLDDEGRLNPDDPERPSVDKLLTDGIDSQLETALLILNARALASVESEHARRGG